MGADEERPRRSNQWETILTTGDRIRCEVPFCRRTAPAAKFEPGTQIICGKCWRLGDKRYRRLYSAANKKWKKTGIERFAWLKHQAWERVRKQAIERAAGIT